MVRESSKRLILTAAFAILACVCASAQRKGQADSLVRLMNGESVELIEQNGIQMRKAVKPTFLHNGTYLICDSSLWYIDEKIINCEGHVQLIQGQTVLTSEHLDYLIDEDLAQFRGETVQLRNKKENILRTRNLDYNTRDSLATFFNGASMRSEEGQVIESDNGTYSSSTHLFEFRGNVNMFTDSVFVKTTALEYDSDLNKAYFTAYIDFWKGGKMLSAGGGWYDRPSETFFFRDDVHALSEEQETWSDSLFYYRNTNDVLMLGRAHVQDTSRRVAALADYILYEDSLSRVTMKKEAAVAMWQKTSEGVDTTYVGADKWVYETVRKCDIPETEIASAKSRLEEMSADAVSEYRKRANEEAEAENARKSDLNPNIKKGGSGIKAANRGSIGGGGDLSKDSDKSSSSSKPSSTKADQAAQAAKAAQVDTLSAQADSLASSDSLSTVIDTTKIGFAYGIGNIRVFKSDMQARCDSLRYTDLDSIARLYKSPVVWNEVKRQYSSDSLFVLIKDQAMDRASLMSNAFIITQEDSTCFDQIKSSDAMAYFGAEQQLSRFDALGDVTAVFYLEEDGTLATVNRVEAKMLSATLKDGDVERIYYFQSPKNDAYPVVQLPETDRRLKGFNWKPADRPVSRTDITDLEVRESEREYFESRPQAKFKYTDVYFPGYMDGVYSALEKAKHKSSGEHRADTLATAVPVAVDTVLAPVTAVPDTLSAVKDTVAATAAPAKEEEMMTDAQLRRALRIAARDARWDELDRRDAEKAAAKEAKKAERAARREEKDAARRARQDARDEQKLQKYIKYYEKQRQRHEGIKESDASGERTSGAETGRDLQTIDESVGETD